MLSEKRNNIEQYHLEENHPEKLQFELYSLDEYLKDSDGCAAKPHMHSFYQIIWFTEGYGKHFVDFKEYDFRQDTVFFVSKGQIHYFDNSICDGYILHFSESFLADENEVSVFLKYTIFNSFESDPCFVLKEGQLESLKQIFSQIQTELNLEGEFAHKDYLKHLLNLFLISIQRIGERRTNKKLSVNNPYHISFVRFRQLLETGYRTIHSVNGYAGLMNVSAKTLTNYTKSVSFQTPLEIINDRLILEAKRLLTHSGLTVNEVGFDLGFEDPSYFVKFFKRHVGMSPGEFRSAVS